jgi:hypothetical protein
MQAETLPSLLERLRSLYPNTVYAIQSSGASPAWWRTVVDVLAALATAAVGVFAFLEVKRANRAERTLREEAAARSLAAATRISAEAHAFRVILFTWLKRSPWTGSHGPLTKATVIDQLKAWAREFVSRRAEADALALSMMSKAPEVTAPIQAALNTCYVKYHLGLSLLDGALVPGLQELDAGNQVILAEHAMSTCLAGLDAVIDPALTAALTAHTTEMQHHEPSRRRGEQLRKILYG